LGVVLIMRSELLKRCHSNDYRVDYLHPRASMLILLVTLIVLSGCGNTIQESLTSLSNPLKTFRADSFPVDALIFTPDGKNLISGSSNSVIRFWDIETGKIVRSINPHESFIAYTDISPDGKTVVGYFGEQHIIGFWSSETKQFIRDLGPESSQAIFLCFSWDSRMIATYGGDENPTISLWEVSTGKKNRTLDGKIFDVYAQRHWKGANSFTRDSKYFVSQGRTQYFAENETCFIWDVTSGKLTCTLKAGLMYDVSPKGDLIATVDNIYSDRFLKVDIWSIQNGKLLGTINNPGFRYFEDIAFVMGGEYLVLAGDYEQDPDNPIYNCMYNCFFIAELKSFKIINVIQGDNNPVFSPDGTRYLVRNCNLPPNEGGFSIDIRSFPNGELINHISGNFRSSPCSLSENGDYLLCVESIERDYFQVYSVKDGKQLCSHDANSWPDQLTCNFEHNIMSHPSDKGWEIDVFDDDMNVIKTNNFIDCPDGIESLDISGDSKTLISLGNDKTIRVIDASTFELKKTFKPKTGTIEIAKITPDGESIVYTWREGSAFYSWNRLSKSIKIRAWKDDKELLTIETKTDPIQDFSISKKHNSVVCNVGFKRTGDDDVGRRLSKLRMWSIDTGEELDIKQGDMYFLEQLTLSPDGSKYAALGDIRDMYWGSLTSGSFHSKEIDTSDRINIEFNFNGNFIVCFSDKTVKTLSGNGRSSIIFDARIIYKAWERIKSFSCSPIENICAIGSDDGRIGILKI